MKYSNDWCVLITSENKEKVKKLLFAKQPEMAQNFSWALKYYGIKRNGYIAAGNFYPISSNILSDIEFEQLYNSYFDIVDNYEIY